jgi:hypothetical protein
VQTQVAVESAFWDNNTDLGEYHVVSSFLQLLMTIFFVYYFYKFIIDGNIRSIELLFLYCGVQVLILLLKNSWCSEPHIQE